MHLTQGTFSYLPAFTDEEIGAQVQYAIDNGWSISIEFTDDPHPRNVYWEMWDLPMFDVQNTSVVLAELQKCRGAHPHRYVRVSAYDRSLGRQTTALSFIVARPKHEPGFELQRTETSDRRQQYTLRSYATKAPSDERY
jgi:ribulose-bisphosphate carboxylase small chain